MSVFICVERRTATGHQSIAVLAHLIATHYDGDMVEPFNGTKLPCHQDCFETWFLHNRPTKALAVPHLITANAETNVEVLFSVIIGLHVACLCAQAWHTQGKGAHLQA